jgi:hypothetical protein
MDMLDWIKCFKDIGVIMAPKPSTGKKEKALDLFKQVLPALYKGDLDFYANQPIEAQKEIPVFVLMRWISLAKGLEGMAPLYINSLVNKGFWSLTKHPELQWKVLATATSLMGQSRMPDHYWLANKKTSKTPMLDSFLLQLYYNQSDYEIDIIKGKLTTEDVIILGKDFGLDDASAKKLLKEFKENYGENS